MKLLYLMIDFNFQIAQATPMIHSACSVLLVNTVRIMDLPYPMEIALLGIIAQRARMYHSPPITPAAQGISVKLEVGMRQDVHQECTSPTGPDPHVKYAQQAPTAKHLVRSITHLLYFILKTRKILLKEHI